MNDYTVGCVTFNKCPHCTAPIEYSSPDGDVRYKKPRPTHNYHELIERLKEAEKKVEVYEMLLHKIRYAEYDINGGSFEKLIRNICKWSYANDPLAMEINKAETEKAFRNLLATDEETH